MVDSINPLDGRSLSPNFSLGYILIGDSKMDKHNTRTHLIVSDSELNENDFFPIAHIHSVACSNRGWRSQLITYS